jgi:hypothetical protein
VTPTALASFSTPACRAEREAWSKAMSLEEARTAGSARRRPSSSLAADGLALVALCQQEKSQL